MRILDTISGHSDLVKLNPAQRETLCHEIRGFLVEQVSKTGGHLASNLGVVELTVALETVFDTEKDRLVFDVGHQSYVHKLLTGRQADFARLRQFGGMAGFPKPGESQTDAFVAGHASSSVSIALGMARARTLQNENYHVAAVIGDGAATGGMAYEGLNDAGYSKEPMIVILNDNGMSIDHNVGGVARHLSGLRSKATYLGMKDFYRSFLSKLPLGGLIYRGSRAVKNWLKRVLIPTTMFENMGFAYYGPVDGHDVNALIGLLRHCKQMRSPVLIHVMTQKGRGYGPAEQHPSKFHGIGKFDPKTGETGSKSKTTFSDTFGQTMIALAAEDHRVCAITAAMPGGTGLLDFKKQYSKRLFDVGIAEEHAVSMAGGLAKQGMIPVVALYSTFLQRSYDQILQDVAMLKLHVVLAVDRAGLVGEDGETHHGIFDVGFLRQAPGMTLLAPASQVELQKMLRWAVKDQSGPVAIRYPRGSDGQYQDSQWDHNSGLVCHRLGKDITIVTYGTLVNQALSAAELLAEEGIDAAVLRLTLLNPLPIGELTAAVHGKVLVVEEINSNSGISGALARELPGAELSCNDLGDGYIPHGSVGELYHKYSLDAAGIAEKAKEVLAP